MKQNLKLRLPLFIFVATIMITLAALCIKYFLVSTIFGKERMDELIVSFVTFALSITITLLLSSLTNNINRIVNIIVTIIQLSINMYLGTKFIHVYYANISIVVNKLVYIFTTNIIIIPQSDFGEALAFLLAFTSLLITVIFFTLIIILIKYMVKRILVLTNNIFIHIKQTKQIILSNVSIGFLYKRIP